MARQTRPAQQSRTPVPAPNDGNGSSRGHANGRKPAAAKGKPRGRADAAAGTGPAAARRVVPSGDVPQDRLPDRMPMGQFLFEYLSRKGVRHSFGVPGDFALPTFAWLDKSRIQNVTMTHEPGAGFAADAYSRLNGIGLCCVTYCVGGLNLLNPIAGAYAEK